MYNSLQLWKTKKVDTKLNLLSYNCIEREVFVMLKKIYAALKLELKEHKSSFIVYFTLRGIVIALGFFSLIGGRYESLFFCILTLILLILPSLFQLTFRVEMPTTLEIILLLFIFAAEILGEISDFYYLFPYWDTVLHTLNGFICAGIGLSLADLLNKNEHVKFELSPIFVALVGFCFSMTIGVMWEFFEYFMDSCFGMNMLKDTIVTTVNSIPTDVVGQLQSITNIQTLHINGELINVAGYIDIGLYDTLNDLLVNFIGASVFSIFGYFYIKNNGDDWVARHFVLTRKEKKKDYLSMTLNEKNEDA